MKKRFLFAAALVTSIGMTACTTSVETTQEGDIDAAMEEAKKEMEGMFDKATEEASKKMEEVKDGVETTIKEEVKQQANEAKKEVVQKATDAKVQMEEKATEEVSNARKSLDM